MVKDNNETIIENNIEGENSLWEIYSSGNDNIVNVTKDDFSNYWC